MTVAFVIPTYNRLSLLKGAIASARRACSFSLHFYVCDGGSTDGTREWVRAQPDTTLLEGGLTGAVAAVNVGTGAAVDAGAEFVVVLNDDSAFETGGEVDAALNDYTAQAVAFEMNTRGPWQCEEWAGLPYGNTCIVRREVGMAVARAQGDPTGRAWWCRDHSTYAADSEFGLQLHRLGWTMVRGVGLRVRDFSVQDEMKKRNVAEYTRPDGTHRLFHARWGTPAQCQYSREDAEKYGGISR